MYNILEIISTSYSRLVNYFKGILTTCGCRYFLLILKACQTELIKVLAQTKREIILVVFYSASYSEERNSLVLIKGFLYRSIYLHFQFGFASVADILTRKGNPSLIISGNQISPLSECTYSWHNKT